VHGDDGVNGDKFAAFPVIHRKWVDTVGYFSPPGFPGDFCDTWLFDVANMIGRRKYLPFTMEHMHVVFGKAPMDSTYREKFARDKQINAKALYDSRLAERERDADKLRKVMRGY
jgi:hypothetical protein